MQNPHVMAALATEHIADLHRDAAHTSGRPRRAETRRQAPGRARRRAGWWLVTFGLRLAVGPAVVTR